MPGRAVTSMAGWAWWVPWLVRVVLALSSATFLALGEWAAALRFFLGIVLLSVPPRAGVPKSYEAVFATVVGFALWCDAGHWYARVGHLDTAVHAALAGSGSIVLFFAFLKVAGSGLRNAVLDVPRWVLLTWISSLGLSAAAMWEIYEWMVEQVSPGSIRVSYSDTVADLAAGLIGTVGAGLIFLPASRRHLAAHRAESGDEGAR
ncbi:hypothetical protein ACWGI0_06185 [Streptomyces sp. NPDC054802]